MKWAGYLVVVLFLLTSIPSAFCQDEVIMLDHDELGLHERPAVKFNHEKHQEAVGECTRCHHDYDEYMNNVGSEGQACSECHGKSGGGHVRPMSSEMSFHIAVRLLLKYSHNHCTDQMWSRLLLPPTYQEPAL